MIKSAYRLIYDIAQQRFEYSFTECESDVKYKQAVEKRVIGGSRSRCRKDRLIHLNNGIQRKLIYNHVCRIYKEVVERQADY